MMPITTRSAQRLNTADPVISIVTKPKCINSPSARLLQHLARHPPQKRNACQQRQADRESIGLRRGNCGRPKGKDDDGEEEMHHKQPSAGGRIVEYPPRDAKR